MPMRIESVTSRGLRAVAVGFGALAMIGLAGCTRDISDVDRAQAQVTAKEKAAKEAEAAFTASSEKFCQASKTYIVALDRYGDVLNNTAPTVGDVKDAGADLGKPREDAFDGAEAAVEAHQEFERAEQELAEARAALERAEAGASGSPSTGATPPPTTPQPSTTPLVPTATVDRVKQAESEFADAQGAVTDQTPLTDASEQFNSAAVALELSWLRLFVDAGCVSDEQTQKAQAAVSAYVTALQQ